MHIPHYKILLIPDFGNLDSTDSLLPLKQALDNDGRFTAMILDLRQTVVDENPGNPLKEVRIIDLAVQKLQTFAREKILEWEDDDPGDPDLCECLHSLASESGEVGREPEEKDGEILPEQESRMPEPESRIPEPERRGIESIVPDCATMRRQLKILIRITSPSELSNLDTPDLIVVFGKSAMLPGGIRECPVLFIDPEYDSEWPWKKRFYADRKEAGAFCKEFAEHLRRPHHPTVTYFGIEYVWPRFKYPKRLGLLTDGREHEEFAERYPRLVLSDPGLRDPEALACVIRDFKMKHLPLPQFEIDRLMTIPARDGRFRQERVTFNFLHPFKLYDGWTFNFLHPVTLQDGRKAVSIEIEPRSPYCVTGTVVRLANCNILAANLDSFHNRHDLTALRDALEEAVKGMPPKKRILIVPDVIEPGYIEIAEALRDRLVNYGHYVAIFEGCYPIPGKEDKADQGNYVPEQNKVALKMSRVGLERCCKRHPFDLIVTLESGCLLAARTTVSPRIFVNPNWTAWEDMRRLGYRRDEWETARTMGMKANIRRDGPHWAMGWFTTDQIDGDYAKAHMERFCNAAYPPHADLINPEGISSLSCQIHKMLL